MQSHIVVGAKVSLYINGLPFARVTGFRWSAETPHKEIRGIDSVIPFELAPTTSSCSGTLELIKMSGDGGAEKAGMAVPDPNLPMAKYFSILLIEKNTNKVLFRATRCVVTSQSWMAAAKGTVTGSLSFHAIDWSNEIQPV